MTRGLICAGGVALCVAVAGARQEPGRDLESLVESERSFAARSVSDGVRTAFLEFLAEGAIVFEPAPSDGRAVHTARPPSDDRLTWYPVMASVADTGDLGYTSGPWRFHAAGRSPDTDAYGHYVSVWQRQADGSWKVVADIGVTHPPVAAGEGRRAVERVGPPSDLRDAGREGGAGPMTSLESLFEADRRFSGQSADRGVSPAYGDHLVEWARIYRPARTPLSRDEALDLIGRLPGEWTWTPLGGDVSDAGDLGYTYGTADQVVPAGPPRASFSYLRIWRRLRVGWRVEIDVMIPAGPNR